MAFIIRNIFRFFIMISITSNFFLFAEEGMYPLSEIHKINLEKAGLKIAPLEIYNPDSTSLVDALVKVGGCTGSFVSPEGLIITNHHCVFGSLQALSTVENNYIESGFLAKERGEEKEAKGIKCRITESYEDISASILDSVKDITDPVDRVNRINEIIKELEQKAEAADTTIEAEVSEMFEGKTYLLFRYKTILDVRIVYSPPRQIGEFGGETDNWMWPRHNSDFAFVRAYVAPDGSPAVYSPQNIPYSPKKFLKVNPQGVKENDFVFILGYPGRTYRHKPSQFLEYQQKYLLPYISGLYDFQIEVMEKISERDPEAEVKLASRIKSLANVTKNYKGKLKGLRKLSLVEEKKDQEKRLLEFINDNPENKNNYGNLFHELDSVYSLVFKNAERDLWLQQIDRASTLIKLADILLVNTKNTADQPGEPKEKMINEIRSKISKDVTLLYQRFNLEADREILRRMLIDASALPGDTRIYAVDNMITGKDTLKAINKFLDKAFDDNELAEQDEFYEMLSIPYDELIESGNLLIRFTYELKNQITASENNNKMIEGTLDKLSAQLLDIKRMYNDSLFTPDANSTLRLTYGRIMGYSPSDAVYNSPITTLDGVIEKSYLDNEEYAVPDKLRVLYNKKDFGRYYNEELKGLPVAILYNTDTTGGNSGSPVMNAYGELVGVNFDRTFEATINDYAWNNNYSRSIGTDIRYVLWITQKFGGAEYLLDEMGIENFKN